MLLFFSLLALLSRSTYATEGPFFSYQVSAGPDDYLMKIEMVFSRDAELNRIVANFQNEQLIHQLYPNADPGETLKLSRPQADRRTYDKILTIHNFGLKTRMLSHCSESGPSEDGSIAWQRHCELDLSKLDGGRAMKSKIEEASCGQEAGEAVHCKLEVRGSIKSFFFVSAAVLTVKAKAQALINWGRFWFYTENGSISAPVSNALFDSSKLARDVEELTQLGLQAAKKDGPFTFAAQGRFPGPEVH